jgi:hypothetical protein
LVVSFLFFFQELLSPSSSCLLFEQVSILPFFSRDPSSSESVAFASYLGWWPVAYLSLDERL